jgi:hypothetical protein
MFASKVRTYLNEAPFTHTHTHINMHKHTDTHTHVHTKIYIICTHDKFVYKWYDYLQVYIKLAFYNCAFFTVNNIFLDFNFNS